MTMQTWLTRELGIRYPIIQGAMLWMARAELASAVSNAGGLGIIAAASFPTGDELRQELRRMRTLTDKPFAVNISIVPARIKINYEEYIRIVLEEGVTIVETSGNPEPYAKLIKQPGVRFLHKVARLKDALAAERLGVDAITIVGFEGAGFTGMDEISSLVVVPRAVDSLKVPVIAAGGFFDGRGLVAALALGACGVQMATRFMMSQECQMHPAIRQFMVEARETDTIRVLRSLRNPARVLKTDYSQNIVKMEEQGATAEDILPLVSGLKTRQYLADGTTGATLSCGQVIGSINKVPTAREIVEGIITDAETVTRRIAA